MTLPVNPWGFTAHCSTRDNFAPQGSNAWPNGGSPPGSFNVGTNNSIGAPVTLLTAAQITNFDGNQVILQYLATPNAGVTNNSIFDLLWDPAGGSSWQTFAAALPGSATSVLSYTFPVAVPRGASFAIQGRANRATTYAARACLTVAGGPTNDGASAVQAVIVDVIGANPTASKGTDVVTGTLLAWGNWTTLGTLPFSIRTAQIGVIPAVTNSVNVLGQKFQLGFIDSAGTHSPCKGFPVFQTVHNGSEQIDIQSPSGPTNLALPSGTVMVVRGIHSNSTALTAGQAASVVLHVTG